MVNIRLATINDVESITNIYNEAILKTVATFDTETKTIKQQRKWFEDHTAKNPVLVAEENGVIFGFASLSKYSNRCAYSDTAEISLYIIEEFQEKGIGKKLMKAIIDEGEKSGLHAVIARITDGNEKSIHLHKSVGFEHIGTMKEVGLKFDKRLDVALMQKVYKNSKSKP
ncbi:MAG: N-acetyltransferase [Thermoplasmatales archaeon]|nr:N-acetyltransferase [Thermoplasmatales archaeon]